MSAADYTALDQQHLLARYLHQCEGVSSHFECADRHWQAPFFGYGKPSSPVLEKGFLHFVPARADSPLPEDSIPVIQGLKMGALVRHIKHLNQQQHPALVYDLSPLASSPPYGDGLWKPKSREDLAELVAVANCPLWLYGIASPADAEVAVEAGVDAIVVANDGLAALSPPACLHLIPEILDVVAGMARLFSAGPVRDGVDIFKYLALGAEAMVIRSDRHLYGLMLELHYAMKLTACETLGDISYEAIYTPLFDDR